MAEIKEFYKNDIVSDDDLNAVAQRYEEKRKEKIQILIQVFFVFLKDFLMFFWKKRKEMKLWKRKKMAICRNIKALEKIVFIGKKFKRNLASNE